MLEFLLTLSGCIFLSTPSFPFSSATSADKFLKVFSDCDINILTPTKDVYPTYSTTIAPFHMKVYGPVKGISDEFNRSRILNTKRVLYYRRFLTCCVLILRAELVDSAGAWLFSALSSIIEHANSLRADFVVTFSNRYAPETFYGKLPKSWNAIMSSMYLFAYRDTNVVMLCRSCEPSTGMKTVNIEPNPTTAETASKGSLKRQYRNPHKNMNLHSVGMEAFLGTEHHCYNPRMKYDGPKNHAYCFLATLKTRHNFTIYPLFDEVLHPTEPYVSKVVGDTYWSRRDEQDGSSYYYDWIPAGETFIQYEILQINDKSAMHVSAVWDALGMARWIWIISLATAMVVAAMVLIFLLPNIPQRRLGLFGSITILVFALLIDKFEISQRITRKFTWRTVLLIFLWAQAAAILSYANKGYLFSHLTSVDVPTVPQNLAELAKSHLKVFSSAYYVYVYDEVKRSIIQDTLGELQQEGLLQQIGLDNVTPTALASKLNFLNDRAIHKVSKQLSALGKDTGKELPSEYVIVDTEPEIRIFMNLMEICGFSHDKVITVGQKIPVFMRRMPLLVQRNFFSTIFTDGVFRLVQAGLWGHWDGHYMHHVEKLELRKLEASAAQTGNKVLLRRLKSLNVLAVLFKSARGAGSLTNGIEETVLSVKALAGMAYVFILSDAHLLLFVFL